MSNSLRNNSWPQRFCTRSVAILVLVSSCAVSDSVDDEGPAFEPGQWVYIIAPHTEIDHTEDPRCGGPYYDRRYEKPKRDAQKPLKETIFEEIIICSPSDAWPAYFSSVEVLETDGSRIRFATPHGHHGRFEAWVDQQHLIDPAWFVPMEGWPRSLLMQVCAEWMGCYEVSKVLSPLKISYIGEADCPFDGVSDTSSCETIGHAVKYREFILFVTEAGSVPGEFALPFVVKEEGQLCWIYALWMHDICMPLEPSGAAVYREEP